MQDYRNIGLYIHIPFCKRKCYYCDFSSYEGKENFIEKYVKCLEKEIVKYASENKIMYNHGLETKYQIETIYIGGGTPSLLDEIYIENIMRIIKSNFDILSNPEITIEVNPGTVNKEKLETYINLGINRLSIGLQVVQDSLLEKIGRIHTYKQFENTYKYAREVGFENINIDLMIGIPNQSMEMVEESVKTILDLKPEHISVYSLMLENGTKLDDMVKNNKMEMPSEELERQMYWYVKKTLAKHKYYQYEISNFAKVGYESKHNLNCWNQKEYIGIGASACSFIDNKRYCNLNNIDKYIKNIEQDNFNKNLILEESLNQESKMKEYMMLGLRKIDGINIIEFEKKFNQNPVVKYCNELERLNHEGLIVIIDENIKLTNKGIDLANIVWKEFV